MENEWQPAAAAAVHHEKERLLRTDQAAARLNCSARRVRQLCQDKFLLALKTGQRKWLIPESAILDYLKAINQD